MLVLAIFLLLLTLILFNNFVWKRRNLPPGPIPLPIIGNKLSLNSHPPGYEAFLRWSKEYGPVFTFWVGENPVVAVTDFGLIEQTFIRDADAYTGRDFNSEFFKTIKGQGDVFGVLHTDGEMWAVTRRFSLQILRDLGVGKSVIEKKIIDETKLLIDWIACDLDSGVQVQNLGDKLDMTIGSIINQLTFGFTFVGERESELRELKHLAHEHVQSTFEMLTKTVIVMPALRHLPIFSKAFKRAEARILHLYAYYDRQIQATVDAQKADGGVDAAPTFFVDAFLRKIDAVRGTEEEKYFNKKNLRGMCQDLFVAGQDTTANTLSFLVCYMIRWPAAQQRMQDELDAFVKGQCANSAEIAGFFVTNADRNHLPYTNAVINETQRLCNLLPENVLHKTTRDVTIAGYRIPEGIRIVPQISCVLFDEKIFPQAQNFKPERFLDEGGKLKACKELVPFSVGKRRCLGEALAKMELFLITANIFLRFKVSAVDPRNPPTLDKVPGIAVSPYPYVCRVEDRAAFAKIKNI